MRTFLLRKHTQGERGTLPVGKSYPWTYTSASLVQARVRAYKALKRDHPREDIKHWGDA